MADQYYTFVKNSVTTTSYNSIVPLLNAAIPKASLSLYEFNPTTQVLQVHGGGKDLTQWKVDIVAAGQTVFGGPWDSEGSKNRGDKLNTASDLLGGNAPADKEIT